jgi:general nucleoside transport system ATP-binding protein
VHKRIVAARDAGAAVLIVSAELDEIYALADRIAVMYEGRITGFRPPSVPVEELGMLMAGSAGGDAAGASGGDSAGPAAGDSAGPGDTPDTADTAGPGDPADPGDPAGPGAGTAVVPGAEQ